MRAGVRQQGECGSAGGRRCSARAIWWRSWERRTGVGLRALKAAGVAVTGFDGMDQGAPGAPAASGQRRGILMARSAMMFFWTSVVPAPIEV
jgi:hypothetical protein